MTKMFWLLWTAGLVSLSISQESTTTQCVGSWTAWTPVSGATCNDTCGMCGIIQVERSCQPEGCLCDNPTNTSSIESCGATVCLYPRVSCCAPYTYKKVVGKNFICVVPPPTTTTLLTTLGISTTTEVFSSTSSSP